MPNNIAVIVLAAGKGTRMKSALPKVLHPLAGKPMLGHVLSAAQALKPKHTVVITGYGAAEVETYCDAEFPGTLYARQTEQKGTGHAVMQAEKALKNFTGTVIIAYGDIMLGSCPHTLPTLLEQHAKNPKGLTMLTAQVENPTGFGRLIKKGKTWVNVEEKDCTPAQRKITTVNPCLYAVSAPLLFKLLKKVKPNNAQKEYYLTDIIELTHKHKLTVHAHAVEATRALIGINSRAELATMEAEVQSALRTHHMANGVTLTDPTTVYFSLDTQIANDTTIGQHVIFGPGVKLEGNVTVLPFCHMEGCVVRSGARIGPFARIRPTSEIGENAHVGNFVEIKNTRFGAASKANHLTYVGDADVGADVNFGAGTITANYNRKTGKKSRTTIGKGASLGSNTVLVAPVTLGARATTGANTTVRQTVEDDALAVTAAQTVIKPNYSKR